jgi:hypothetical protein
MNFLFKSITFLLLFSFISVSSFAQSSPLILQTDRSQVIEGETFVLEVSLENVDSENIKMPDLSPFEIVQPPSTSRSMTIINGKRSSSIGQKYLLLAPKVGKFKIGPATVKLGSKTIQSNTLTIEVLKSSPKSQAEPATVKNDITLVLELSATTGYIGQQLILDYVIYTRKNIETYNIVDAPNQEGFYVQPLNDIRDAGRRKSINGKEYYTQVVKREILFPQKSGNYTLGPLTMDVDVPTENGQSSFFFRETKKVSVKSNTVKIKILPLPEPVPNDFCGAAGMIDLVSKLQKSTVTVGKAFGITLYIEGYGDPKTIKAPKFDVPDGLEGYEPSLIQEEIVNQNDKILVRKQYEYLFVPQKDTIYTITPQLSFYDPINNKYQKVVNEKLTINAVKSDSDITEGNSSDQDYSKYIKEGTQVHHIKNKSWGSWWHIGSVLGIVLATLGGIFWKRKTMIQEKNQKEESNKAGNIAKKRLSKASSFFQAGDAKSFYEEIAWATTGYILQKYDIPNSEASVSSIIQIMEERGAEREIIQQYQWLHQQSEIARFAGKYGDLTEVMQKAEYLITTLEK